MYCVQHCASYFFVTIVRVFPNFRWDDEWASFPTHFKVFLCNDHILSPDAIRRTCVREESWGWSSDTRGIHTFGPKGPECWLWHMELHQAFLGEFAQDFLCRKLFVFLLFPPPFPTSTTSTYCKKGFKMQNHAKDIRLVPCRAWNPDFAPWLENGICMTSPDNGSLNIETMWLVLCHQNPWLRLAGKLRTQSLDPRGPHFFQTSAYPHTFVPRHLRLLDPVSWCSSGKASRSEMPAGAFSKVRAADIERQNQKMLCLLDPQQREWYRWANCFAFFLKL